MLGLVLACNSFKRTPDPSFINHPTLLARNAKLLTQSSDGCVPSNGGEILQGDLAEQRREAKYMLLASKCSFLRLSTFIFSAGLCFLPCPHKKKTTTVFFCDTPNNTYLCCIFTVMMSLLCHSSAQREFSLGGLLAMMWLSCRRAIMWANPELHLAVLCQPALQSMSVTSGGHMHLTC